MLSIDSSIQKSADLKTQSSSGSWVERVLLTPSNISKKSAKFFYEWLKTTNLQLPQKSFKACLRKLTIAPFIPRNNILYYFQKLEKKSNKQKNSK